MTINCHRCGQAVTQTSLMCCGVQYGLNGNAIDPELRQIISACAAGAPTVQSAQLLPQVCRLYAADIAALRETLSLTREREHLCRRQLEQAMRRLERIRECVDD